VEADEKIKRVDTEERQSSLLSTFPSLFPTIIFDIVCYFCGIFITKSSGCSRFSGRPSLLCSAVQTASVRVDTPRNYYDAVPSSPYEPNRIQLIKVHVKSRRLELAQQG